MSTKEPDSMINLVVHGRTPSKKNSKQIVHVRGRMLILPSKDYKSWHEGALNVLKTAKMVPKSIEKVRAVHLCFYGENKRKFDLSNKAESIMDLLVDAGILLDDNYEVVPELCLTYGGIDKDNPRCDVTIYII
mgnify:FL=1